MERAKEVLVAAKAYYSGLMEAIVQKVAETSDETNLQKQVDELQKKIDKLPKELKKRGRGVERTLIQR